ncbi:MAG TPA: methylcobamide--CoM methyltransferase [Dehalococcoidia bacterium]|nr:methylcobamide--CoM methyltransferase [Dehalococcoidia bacterium]
MIITVVGNYPKIPNRPRPARLRNAYARFDRGEITWEDVRKVQDQVTIEVLKEQAEAGVELVTDGQIRWDDEQTYLAGAMAGIEITGLIRFFDTNTFYREPLIKGPIAWKGPITVRDFEFAKANSERPVKPVLTGPLTLARLSKNEHYADTVSVALAFAEALNREAKALVAAGATLVQFNEPAACRFQEDASFAAKVWRRLLDGVNAETAVYFYFGVPGAALGPAIEAGFTTVGVDYVDPRGSEQIRAGPRPRKLAAGVVDSRNTRLETVEQIVARVREAVEVAGSANLYVNPNMGLEFLPREQAYDKLVRLVEGVKKAREALG